MPNECPECGAGLRKNARRCECGWQRGKARAPVTCCQCGRAAQLPIRASYYCHQHYDEHMMAHPELQSFQHRQLMERIAQHDDWFRQDGETRTEYRERMIRVTRELAKKAVKPLPYDKDSKVA